MPIELSDSVTTEDVARRQGLAKPVGIVLYEGDSWLARCASLEFTRRGRGPLDVPSSAHWLTNLTYSEYDGLRAVFEQQGVVVKNREWTHISIDEIAELWGIAHRTVDERIDILGHVVERVTRIAMCAVTQFCKTRSSARIPSVEFLHSLPIIARKAIDPYLDNESAEGRILKHPVTAGALTYACFLPATDGNSEEGYRSIRFYRPPLTHAREVMAAKTPGTGIWRFGRIGSQKLTDADLKDLDAFNRPALVMGSLCLDKNQRRRMAHWTYAMNSHTPRSAVTLEEAHVLAKRGAILNPEAYVGAGWTRPVSAELFDALISQAGSERIAHMSISANIAAGSLLSGVYKPGFRKDAPFVQAPENIWLAMRDRMLLQPYVDRLIDAGAEVNQAFNGRIRVAVPDDPEVITNICHEAWEAGLFMGIGPAQELRKIGVDVPKKAASFGGAPQDAFLAVALQGGLQVPLWQADEVLDFDRDMREEALNDMMRKRKSA